MGPFPLFSKNKQKLPFCHTFWPPKKLRRKCLIVTNFSNNQIGFLKGHRTADHVLLTDTIIHEIVHKRRKRLFVAFVDLKKAYDRVKTKFMLSILQPFLKKIIGPVLSTAVFWQFLSIPRPYRHNFTCGETVTYNWCQQLVLLHHFAIKVMFKAFY